MVLRLRRIERRGGVSRTLIQPFDGRSRLLRPSAPCPRRRLRGAGPRRRRDGKTGFCVFLDPVEAHALDQLDQRLAARAIHPPAVGADHALRSSARQRHRRVRHQRHAPDHVRRRADFGRDRAGDATQFPVERFCSGLWPDGGRRQRHRHEFRGGDGQGGLGWATAPSLTGFFAGTSRPREPSSRRRRGSSARSVPPPARTACRAGKCRGR